MRRSEDENGELLQIEDLLPSPDAGPEALYVRSVLLDELEFALDELPEEQREVFVAHELEGRSFKEIVGRERRQRQHVALAQALCGAASAASGCRHLRRVYEEVRNDKMSMKWIGRDISGRTGDTDLYRRRRPGGVAPVELAAAVAVWLARDHVLAGGRNSGAVPHPVR